MKTRRCSALLVCAIMLGAIYSVWVRTPDMRATVVVPALTLGLALFVARKSR